MTTQQHHIQHILNLKQDNPELEIHFCIDSEEISDYQWTDHQISLVEILPWYRKDELILNYELAIKESMYSEISDDIPDEEADAIVNERYQKEVKQAICVFTFATRPESD